MKKSILLFSAICFICNISYSQAPEWIWAKSAIGSGDDQAQSIAVDASGNSYVAGGYASPTLTFGSSTLSNAFANNGNNAIFLTKYDANGNVLWAKSAGGLISDEIKSIAVDALGNIYVTGHFCCTIIFDSDTLTNIHTGNDDIFLAKYDSNGNVIWAKSAGGYGLDYSGFIALDTNGNAYWSGGFYGSNINFDTITLTNIGYSNFFLAKYDANGNVKWAKNASGYAQTATSVAADVFGNIYLVGVFIGSYINFDSITLINHGYTNSYTNDIFFAKYDTNGNVLWAKSVGGIQRDIVNSVVVDYSANIYMTGSFNSSTITFDSTILTNAGAGAEDIFLAKYDAYGNVLWAKSAGGINSDVANSIAVDALGNTYITGHFENHTLAFDSTIITNLTSDGHTDIFLTKYDAGGNVLWAKSAGGISRDIASSVAVNNLGNVYIGGYFFSPTPIFGNTTLINTDSAGFTFDIFIAKLNSSVGINELSNQFNITISPNPTSDEITIIIPEKSTIEIFNINGQIIKSIYSKSISTIVDLRNLSSGIYIIKAKTDKGVAIKKFIKQ